MKTINPLTMKTILISLLFFIGSNLFAQSDQIIHSATLQCYIDLDKIVGISNLNHYPEIVGWYNGPSENIIHSGQWFFSIMYEFRSDYTHYFYADTTKAHEVYNRIIHKWKEYQQPLPNIPPTKKMWIRKTAIYPDSTYYIYWPFYIQSDTITLFEPLNK